jgi:hypothetical protein
MTDQQLEELIANDELNELFNSPLSPPLPPAITEQTDPDPEVPERVGRRAVPKDMNFAEAFRKAIVLSIEIGSIGSTRKINTDKIEVDSDKERVGANKSLLICPEHSAIKSAQCELKAFIKARSVPSNFRAGMFLVPLDLVEEVENGIESRVARINGLVDALVNVYEQVIETDKVALRSNFNPRDYPPKGQVAGRFTISWQYTSYGVPDRLPENVLAKEQERSRQRLRDTTEEIQAVLRGEMAKMVNRMVESLTGTRTDRKGMQKPAIFKDTLIDNLKEWLSMFNARNITNDAELEAICNQARSLLDGVDAQALRDSDQARVLIANSFENIKGQLDSMMVPAGTRAINLTDEYV